MTLEQSKYEDRLAAYADRHGVLQLLRNVRPYLEMLPSTRRPDESLLTIPLPLLRVRESVPAGLSNVSNLAAGDVVQAPCDIAVLMCDPDWKIKTGAEIFIFIHRPHEDFSTLLGRWRQTQLWINKGYDWVMPARYRHMVGEGAETSHPLFILFPHSPQRIKRGLNGAGLPYVIEQAPSESPEEWPEGTHTSALSSPDSQSASLQPPECSDPLPEVSEADIVGPDNGPGLDDG